VATHDRAAPASSDVDRDTGNLRIYVRNMARAMDNGGVQVNEEHKVIEGAERARLLLQGARFAQEDQAADQGAGGEYTDA
jgi:hypothetical protein